jgi:glycosyltransferase involved in cell wall biosynthesis
MRLPQVVTLHHLTEGRRTRLAETFFYADAIVATARNSQTELSALSGREVFFMPYGVDSKVFAFSTDKALAKQAMGVDAGEFVVGFVGKASADVENRKGTELLREICLKMRDVVGAATLLMVGPGWDSLATEFTRAGVRVVRKQYADARDTPAAYAAMDALLVTSRLEGGPCTILEAMACGTPVIASNVGHVPETITDGENGFVCPNRTFDEYLRRLRLLYTDIPLRKRIAAAGRSYIERDRDDAVLVKRLPIEACYLSATQHYARRSRRDHLMRLVRQPVFALKFLASSIRKIR